MSKVPEYGSVLPDTTAMLKKMNEALKKAVHEHNVQVENLTRAQFIEALKQACASGDFQRHVVVGPEHRQAVTYIPFRHSEEHRQRIRELEAQVAQLLKEAAERL